LKPFSLLKSFLFRRSLLLSEGSLLALLIASFISKYVMLRPLVFEPFFPGLIKHDAAVFAAIGICALLSGVLSAQGPTDGLYRKARAVLALILRAAALAILLLYVLDVATIYFFNTRMYFTDVLLFKGEARGALTLFTTWFHDLMRKPVHKIAFMAVSILVLVFAVLRYLTGSRNVSNKERIGHAAAVVLSICLYYIPLPLYTSSFIYKPLVENFFERNRGLLFPISYSEAFKRKLVADFKDVAVCDSGRDKRLNIVLVIVESLSAYHSRAASGVMDCTPRMDSLASRYTRIPDFFANGWTTQGGLISLLTSAYPIVPERAEFNEFGSPRLKDYAHPLRSLPHSFRDLGYKTGFYCAGDLTFMGQDEWLKLLGFEDISGDDAPEFAGQPRGVFKAVPDSALYQKALHSMRSWDANDRHVLILETLWSHRPYLSTDSSVAATEENTFRYVDRQFAQFQRDLRSQGFFKDGILIVTGDHRAMQPYRKEEVERFGLSAPARVPFIVIEDSLHLPHIIPGIFSQKDVLPSLLGLVSPKNCRSQYEGDFLAAEPKAPPYIFHARGDDRDRIYVRSSREEGIVELKGKDADFIAGHFTDPKPVFEKLHYERIQN
jgi:hypothetical protein